jgi:hypothetical protein
MGPGGRRCTCCFPAPGSNGRYLEYRRAKKKEKKEAIKIAFDDIKKPVDF